MVPVSGYDEPPCGPDSMDDGGLCVVLGESWVNQSAIESARAAAQPGVGAVVYPIFTDEGIEAFNEIVARCFAKTDDCETGRIAIMNEGELISAPEVNAERFEKDSLVIGGGNFDTSQAEALADAING